EGLDVGEGVEAARGLLAGDPRDGVEPIHQNVPAAGVVRHHLIHAGSALQSLRGRRLGEGGHAGGHTLLQLGHLFDVPR
ncbi:SWIM-type domain-containing protein, partial [Dysosmobacter welbionis]